MKISEALDIVLRMADAAALYRNDPMDANEREAYERIDQLHRNALRLEARIEERILATSAGDRLSFELQDNV